VMGMLVGAVAAGLTLCGLDMGGVMGTRRSDATP
jgi:hypothetical protein